MEIEADCVDHSFYIPDDVIQMMAEKGKIADLLVIQEDPLQDIKNLRKVKMIVQDGKIVKQ